MALLAEQLVEEWLNRQGFFTIRGCKIGVQEIDLLAVRIAGKNPECRHIEVQASVRPVSYVTGVSKSLQKSSGRKSGSAKKRSDEELQECVQEWVKKKFLLPIKQAMRDSLAQALWSYELVVHQVKYPEELCVIENHGVKIHRLSEIIKDLKTASKKHIVAGAGGTDFVDLLYL